jgi:hypothetical protein
MMGHANTNQLFEPARYFPMDFTYQFREHAFSGSMASLLETQRPGMLRSHFVFPLHYGYEDEPGTERRKKLNEVKTKYTTFIENTLLAFLTEAAEKMEFADLYFSGDGVSSAEIELAVFKDIMLALGSIFFVTFYMYCNIRSWIVTLGCFCIIFASVPVAYVLTPMAKVTIASFMSLFLITVIDIDVIFVFLEFWDQGQHLEQLDRRIVYMLLNAGQSCLATSLTTALSFFANLASVLQPLREFGLFIGLSVMAVYIFALLFLPPLLILRERQKRRAHARKCQDSDHVGADLEASERSTPCFISCRTRRGESIVNKFLMWLVGFTARRSCIIIFITLACFPAFVVCIYIKLDIDLGVPEVFPAKHNQIAYKRFAKMFENVNAVEIDQLPVQDSSACDVSLINQQEPMPPCAFYWCEVAAPPTIPAPKANAEAPMLAPVPDSSSVGDDMLSPSCWRSPTLKTDPDDMLPPSVSEDRPWGVEYCASVNVNAKLVAKAWGDSMSDLWLLTMQDMVSQIAAPIDAQLVSVGSLVEIEPLVMEEWDTGTTHISKLLQSGKVSIPLHLGTAVCEVHTMCFLTSPICAIQGWRRLNISEKVVPNGRLLHESHTSEPSENTLTGPAARASPRWLQQADAGVVPEGVVPEGKRFDVVVVWGLRAPKTTPLVGVPSETWSYDPTFEPGDPWSQRAIKAMCDDAMSREELLILTTDCWINHFREWLRTKGQLFPSRDFKNDVLRWARTNPDTVGNIWVEDGKIIACKVMFYVDASKSMKANKGLKFKANWDNYVDLQNSRATVAAKFSWHTASVWVRTEAQIAILSSTVDTVLIECGLSWLGITMFTGDPLIALLVLGIVLVNISGLLFVMTVMLGWALGPIEIVFVIVFLGYSVTYGLHLANNFAAVSRHDVEIAAVELRFPSKRPAMDDEMEFDEDDPDEPLALSPHVAGFHVDDTSKASKPPVPAEMSEREFRFARVRIAVLHVGGAILSSTVSTVGSSIFLLMCTMNIFIRLGFVIMTVVALSILMTLISLPAVLMVCGPRADPCYKQKPRRLVRWALGRSSDSSSGATDSTASPDGPDNHSSTESSEEEQEEELEEDDEFLE